MKEKERKRKKWKGGEKGEERYKMRRKKVAGLERTCSIAQGYCLRPGWSCMYHISSANLSAFKNTDSSVFYTEIETKNT